MVTCAVVDCGVNQRNNPENCSFHRFPLDPVLRRKWLILIGRVGWSPIKSSTVCSKHFLVEYKRKSNKNTILVKSAIPTLFVPGKLKVRAPSTYIYRDIQHSTPPEKEKSSQREKQLLLRIEKLKLKLSIKQKKIRNLRAICRSQDVKIMRLQYVLNAFQTRPEVKDHSSDVTIFYV